MFARLLVVGLSCWLAMGSLVDAAPSDEPVAPPLFDNLGSLHHPITTTSEQAQRYFDQGLRLVYAFNHEEALRSFEAAVHQDSQAAMPYWGIALALGPNINSSMEKKDEHRAIEMVQKAQRLAESATSVEQAYIEALVVRYVGRKGAKRKGLDEAYAKAMRSVAQRFPEDDDAATLFAEAMMDLRPWDFWKPEGDRSLAPMRSSPRLSPCSRETPIIRGPATTTCTLLEASSYPERASPCAERLPDLMPGAGHLVHMPAHIYIRLGKYHEAAERNQHAAQVDEPTSQAEHRTGDYADGYYTHNLHFLWASLSMEGRNGGSHEGARDLTTPLQKRKPCKDKGKNSTSRRRSTR